MKQKIQAYHPSQLPIDSSFIKTEMFLDELIDASTKLEVYKEKIKRITDYNTYRRSDHIALRMRQLAGWFVG